MKKLLLFLLPFICCASLPTYAQQQSIKERINAIKSDPNYLWESSTWRSGAGQTEDSVFIIAAGLLRDDINARIHKQYTLKELLPFIGKKRIIRGSNAVEIFVYAHKDSIKVTRAAKAAQTVSAGQSVSFRIAGSPACSQEKKVCIEEIVSMLLTEISDKGRRNQPLNLLRIPMTERARQSLTNRWKNFHYVCEDLSNVEKLLETVDGYEVRGIPVEVRPTGKGYDGDTYRELVVCLSKDARQITDVHPALSNNSYTQVLTRGEDVVDTRRRTEILSFVESFRSYYDEKDLKAIDQIFSEDALIITGKMVMKKSNEGDRPTLKPEYEYKKQSKTQYLSNLDKVFKNNQYIKVDFNDIEIMRHPGTNKQNWYGVTLRQHWKSEGKWSSYQDDGYVFLLWEFKDNQPPLIHVRTWQEEQLHGKSLKKDDIFNINDFFIE